MIEEEYLNKNLQREHINVRVFDENEKLARDVIVTWKENGNTIFGMNKKKSQSKDFKRIKYHLIIKDTVNNLDESPCLIKCKGCEKNIQKKTRNSICLIYLNNQDSRIIKQRMEDNYINLMKRYETL